MKCNNCGQNIPDNASFCTNCGNKVAQPQVPQQNVQPQNQVPNQQQFNQVPNQQQFNQVPNPQQFNQAPNPQQFNQAPNPQQFNQAPNPQQFNQAPNGNFNQMPNGNFHPQGYPVAPKQSSPIVAWLESAKNVFLDFFKKGFINKPTTLLTEKNHMWLVFVVASVIIGALCGLLSHTDYYFNKFHYVLSGFLSAGALFFAFATAIFIYAKMAKNNNITYVNAMNATSGAYIPVILATVASCLVGFVNSSLAYDATTIAQIMFFILMYNVIGKVVEGSKYEHSFWFRTLSIIIPFLVYNIFIGVFNAIFTVDSLFNSIGNIFDNLDL